jgi:hemoglobin
MRIEPRRGCGFLAALLLIGAASPSPAADQPRPTGAASSQQLSELLRDVINRGADLYNNGDRNGCYRLFQGALMVFRAQLSDPDLRKAIDAGVAEAEQMPSVDQRAHALRRVLDGVRVKVKAQRANVGSSEMPRERPEKKAAQPANVPDSKPPEKRPETKTQPPKAPASKTTEERPETIRPPKLESTTLWDRLGGDSGVKKVIDDFVDLAASDRKVNFDRNGKFKLDAAAVTRLKEQLRDFISQATGGPYSYRGKSMKEVHRGMGITNAEFDALAADLKQALERNGVGAADIEQVMQVVGAARADIVEGSAASEKKPADKKP